MVTIYNNGDNTYYLHNAWSSSPDGTTDFTLDEEEGENREYIGTAITTDEEELTYGYFYSWSQTDPTYAESATKTELIEDQNITGDLEAEDPDNIYDSDDYLALEIDAAKQTAEGAQDYAETAKQKADEATASAEIAQAKAEEATASAAEAKTAAESAVTDAATAKTKAEEATVSAATAQTEAQNATASATTAGKAAAVAQAAAEAAQADIDEELKYFYHDKNGAHVLDANGEAYRADIASKGLSIVDTSTESTVSEFSSNGMNLYSAGDSVFRVTGGQDPDGIACMMAINESVCPNPDWPVTFTTEEIHDCIDNDKPWTLTFSLDTYPELETEGSSFDDFVIKDLSVTLTANAVKDSAIYEHGETINYHVFRVFNTMFGTGTLLSYTYKITITANSGFKSFLDEYGLKCIKVKYKKISDAQTKVAIGSNTDPVVTYDDDTAIYGYPFSIKLNKNTPFSVDRSGQTYAKSINGKLAAYTEVSASTVKATRYLDDDGDPLITTGRDEVTGKFALTKGSVVTNPVFVRYGNLVQLFARVKTTSSTATGDNSIEGQLYNIPKPTVTSVRTMDYYGSHLNVVYLDQDGLFKCRHIGSSEFASGSTITVSMLYICNDETITYDATITTASEV